MSMGIEWHATKFCQLSEWVVSRALELTKHLYIVGLSPFRKCTDVSHTEKRRRRNMALAFLKMASAE